MPKIDLDALSPDTVSGYPPELTAKRGPKSRLRLGAAAGLTQFGVNLSTLPPGSMSALRHWHENEDEFVMVVSGRATLIDNDGAHEMGPGDCAGFAAGVPNGHHFVNRSDADVVILEVGTRSADERGHYTDDDLAVVRRDGVNRFTRRDGSGFE